MVPVDPKVYVFPMDRPALGRAGEDAAAAALAARGHVILCRNVRTRYGEIDLVTAHGGDLVFVEVKTRTSDEYGRPFDAIQPHKQRRLARLARAFMQERGLSNRACRFDAAAVLITRDGRVLGVEIVPDAFDAPI
jgi:putative endonuclease